MNTSLRWLLSHIDGCTLEPGAVEHTLMDMGFPVESREPLPDGDLRLDVEVTSNRGDCLCHYGLAREVAARTGATLKPMTPPDVPTGPAVGGSLALENSTPDACPLFTARVIRGVRVGPSPAWLRERLEAAGQRSINNVVDVTNYVNLELGNPCHAFDLAKLAGARLVVRFAHEGERLTTLDAKARTLRADELVVADAQRAQSLAGVIGGGESEVTASTTDVVFEVATWSPAIVRRAARRHGVRTDASYRFERTVDPRTLDFASRLGASLVASLGGGKVCEGVLASGPASLEPTRVTLRPRRCGAILGYGVTTEEIAQALTRVGVTCEPVGRAAGEILCTIPAHRPDLTREIDLIEEVARTRGLAQVPLLERLPVRVRPSQRHESARRVLGEVLTGLGFFETVTFSFASRKEAGFFLSPGAALVEVDDERRRAEPALRPSVLLGLLGCRRANQHAQASAPGGVRFFEVASAFLQSGASGSERARLAMLMDVPGEGRKRSVADKQLAIRLMRGAIETIARRLAGANTVVELEIARPDCAAWDASAFAHVTLGSRRIGEVGLVSTGVMAAFDLAVPVICAELDLEPLVAGFPPRATVVPLPAFPGTERDLSIIVPEQVTWASVAATIRANQRPPLEAFRYVTTYRGEQAGPGKKSITLRLVFRDPARTLQSEEADAPTAWLVDALRREHGAALRA